MNNANTKVINKYIYSDKAVVSNDDSHNITGDDSSDNTSIFDQDYKNKIVKTIMIAITLVLSNVNDYDNETDDSDSRNSEVK